MAFTLRVIYDVNLEKCALLKCLCGSAFAAGQAPVRSLAL